MSANNLRSLYRRRLVPPGVRDAIREPLYDRLVYESGVTTQLRYFSVPISGTKTKAETNMDLAGQLSKGWKFIAETLAIQVLPGSTNVAAVTYTRQQPVLSSGTVVAAGTAQAVPNFLNDVWAILNTGWLELTVGSRPYLTAPLLSFPSLTGIIGEVAAAVENTTAASANVTTCDYARLAGKPFLFNPALPLEENLIFNVTLNWPTAVTLPSGFDPAILVQLDGLKFRT